MAQVIQGYCRNISRFCSKTFAFDYCGKMQQTERNKCKQPTNNDNKVRNSMSSRVERKNICKTKAMINIRNKQQNKMKARHYCMQLRSQL